MIFDGVGTVMPVWQIHRVDPGYLYIIESHGKYKIGMTTSTKERFSAAKTWLPDMQLIAFNGEGMVELLIAMDEQGLTLPKFQKQESSVKKKT